MVDIAGNCIESGNGFGPVLFRRKSEMLCN